jgi:hypothetical protein
MGTATAYSVRVAALAAVFGCGLIASSATRAASPTEPLTYLYDAPAPADQPSEDRLSKRTGWTTLAEDDLSHRFIGCAALANDKILALLPQDSVELRIYSRQLGGLPLCGRLQPVCGDRSDWKRTSLAIRENGRSAVAIEVGFASGVETHRLTYELTAGAEFVKATAGPGVEKLRVHAPCPFAVLPDFFGDDMLIDASAIPVARADIPGENFLLHMMHRGDAIAMTVSESRDNDIQVALSGGSPRSIVHSDVSFGKKPRIWVAVLAEKGVWHERRVAFADAGKTLDLDWKAPFPALWRVDWSTADKMTDSWEMLLQQPDDKYVMQGWFGQDESQGQRFGREFGDRDWNKPGRRRWNPVLGAFSFPCWIDKEGRGHLEPLKARRYAEGGPTYNFAGPAVVYPIDRAKTPTFHTPLEKLTIVDLVRRTLGVGPCEYILDLEGQKRNSRGVATCYGRDVINAIYKEGTQLNNRAVIEEHLAATVAFITNVRERIDLYVKFGREMTAYLQRQKQLRPQHAEFLDELLLVTERLERSFEESREKIRTPAFAEATAEGFRKNLMGYVERDAYRKCETQMAVFTSIGGAQDALVASCRMSVKTLRQRAGIAMAVNPELKEIANEIRSRTQAILRNPTPYEAPRH